MGIIFLHSTKTCFLSFLTKAALQGPWPELHYMKLLKKKKNLSPTQIMEARRVSTTLQQEAPSVSSIAAVRDKQDTAVQNGRPHRLPYLPPPTNPAKASMVVWWQRSGRSGRRLCRGMAHGAHCHSVASDRQHLSFRSQRKFCPWDAASPLKLRWWKPHEPDEVDFFHVPTNIYI